MGSEQQAAKPNPINPTDEGSGPPGENKRGNKKNKKGLQFADLERGSRSECFIPFRGVETSHGLQ